MKKSNKDRLIVILIICILISLFFAYIIINKDHISNKIWIAINNQLRQEHLEEIESDYVSTIFLGTPFEIKHYKTKSELVYNTEEKTVVILEDIIINKGNVQDEYPDHYIVASDGYGIITDSGEAIIHLKSGKKKVFDASIRYIDSFEEFSDNQQRIFIKLSK